MIVSFGGADGTEIGVSCTSVSSLQAQYQAVINQYHLKSIDLDIEGNTLDNTSANDRRNKAIKALEAANPGLRVSYTLPVDPSGLPSNAISLLNNAKSNGTRVDVVNIMAMVYGACNIDMGTTADNATKATHTQLVNMGLSAKVGITPMIGVNDVTCENFTTSNASTVTNFANANTSYVSMIAYWELSADSSYSYLKIFHGFR